MNRELHVPLPKYKNNILFIAAIIAAYAVFTRPLIFPIFIASEIRVIVECIPFLLLMFLDKNSFKLCFSILIFLFLFLIINFLINEATLKTSFLIYLKFSSFFIILYLLKKNKYLNDFIKIFFEIFWLIVSISVILSFILYWINPNLFSYSPIEVNEFGDGYEYYNNFYLGNLRLPYMFGNPVPKPSWYFFEAGLLSCFFMLNFVGSKYLIENRYRRIIFTYSNLIAGLCTLSVTFYLCLSFILIYYVFNNLKLLLLISIIIFLTSLILFFGFSYFDLIELIFNFFQSGTSIGDRSNRFDLFLKLLKENSIQVLFIGLGAELEGLSVDFNMSSGWLSHIIERGVIFAFILFLFTIYLTKRDYVIMIVVLLFNLSFNFFGYPIFLIMMAVILSSNSFKRSKKELLS